MFTAITENGTILRGKSLRKLAWLIACEYFTRSEYADVLATLTYLGSVCNGMTTITLS